MTEVIIWDPLSLFFGNIAFCILIIGGLLYLKEGREKQNLKERIAMFGYSASLFSFACYLIFSFWLGIFIPGTYRDNAFYADYSRINFFTEFFFKMSIVSFYIGFLLFIFVFENNFKRTKYILTIIGVILILMSVMFPINSDMHVIPYIYLGVLSFFVLINYTKWTQLEYKIISSFIVAGLNCIGWAGALSLQRIVYESDFGYPVWISPLLMCIGGVLMIAPILITPKNLSHSLVYCLLLISFTICLQIIFLLVYIYSNFLIGIISTIIFTPIYVYIQYTLLKSIKAFYSEAEIAKKQESHPDILGMFIRPQRLTEEEVSVAKEKKVCLVCKNRVLRLSYICPECDAFYCVKCSDVLSDLENACWVCETPFDESKPVKLPEKEEEQVLLEEKDYKKGTGDAN